LADQINVPRFSTQLPEFKETENAVKDRITKLMGIQGPKSVDSIHKRLGKVMWDNVGMGRTKESLEAAITEIQEIRADYWKSVRIPGSPNEMNVELEKALRLADFLELGELMARDALHRLESCGGHFREEYQTPDGEALRDDVNFMYVGAWEYTGENKTPVLHKEALVYEELEVKTRNYKE
jgi:succinate dehydrogenase / fumarate reductase flavoprotein subunit